MDFISSQVLLTADFSRHSAKNRTEFLLVYPLWFNTQEFLDLLPAYTMPGTRMQKECRMQFNVECVLFKLSGILLVMMNRQILFTFFCFFSSWSPEKSLTWTTYIPCFLVYHVNPGDIWCLETEPNVTLVRLLTW